MNPADAPPLDPAAHLGLVHALAARRVPARHSVEDSEPFGDGMLGLTLAIQRFNPARHCTFATFAHRTIRGTILNGIRDRWFGPSVGPPIRVPSFSDHLAAEGLASMDDHLAVPPPDREIEQRDLAGWLLEALDPRERRLVERYVMLGWTLEEVGAAETPPISFEWVRQIVGKAKAKMRARAADLEPVAMP
jgi:RNA polymerase sigma factor (sigma-70 family)